jgi:biopolymer transport protein ExbD
VLARWSVAIAMLAIATGFAFTESERSPVADERVESSERSELVGKSHCGVAVSLPESWEVPSSVEVPTMVLLIATDGTIDINGRQFRDGQLDDLFRAVFAHDKGTNVVFKVHKGVTHRRIVNMMERAKAVGLTRFAIGITER